ncbi:MAG: FCD domain-containing protein [Propionibacteriaceae bacterium]|jgi:DNA-binding FadR family transcriptional regulator|nr:FCD domain-containing protein [Propionibacteriaceae bacterium]
MTAQFPGATPTQATTGVAKAAVNLHDTVTERLGPAIASGEIRPGTSLLLDQLATDYQVSRSVIREVVRVLASLGMVAMRRHVGIVVQPMRQWNLFAPQIIRWRLASSERVAQFRSLTELRTAIEPEAAFLSATRAHLDEAGDLMSLAGRLWVAGQSDDPSVYLDLDVQFHGLVLVSSGNEMFTAFAPVVTEILTSRTHAGLIPTHPHIEALQAHVDVASAIQRGNADQAKSAMESIVARSLTEMSSIWNDLPNRPSATTTPIG